MKYIPVKDLAEGMITASSLYSSDNRLMLAANMKLTKLMVDRLGIFGFYGIYVLDGTDDAAYKPLLDDETRQSAIRAQKSLDVDQIRYVANAIMNRVAYGSDRLYDMEEVSAYDDITYAHSVNVAVLSVMVGVAMGFGNDRLSELGEAALLHDIGKTRVDPAIIKKPGKLTDAEFAAVKRHPNYGYEMLSGMDSVPGAVRLAVLSHHENEDGSGYPNRLQGRDIHPYAKIIHVADVYDAMASKRHYKDRMNPADVLEHLMGGAGTLYDLDCVKALASCVALYPNGVKVRLSNGLSAWVQENHKGYPARPVVKTDTGLVIDLMSVLNVTVTKILEG